MNEYQEYGAYQIHSPGREGRRFPLERVSWHDFEHAVEYFRRFCAVCWFVAREGRREHRYPDCPIAGSIEGSSIRHEVREWKEVIRWARYAACFRCGLPSTMCPRFRRRANGRFDVVRDGRCPSMGGFEGDDEVRVEGMIGLWALAYQYGIHECADDMGWWLAADGISGDDRTAVGRWLGSKVVWEGQEASRIHQIFTWLWVGVHEMRREAVVIAMERVRGRWLEGSGS